MDRMNRMDEMDFGSFTGTFERVDRAHGAARGALVVLVLVAAWGGALPTGAEEPASDIPHVLVVTDRGELELELFPQQAPITVANFLRYVDRGIYDTGATFYRVVRPDNQPGHPVPIEVIQGGLTIEDEHPRRLAPIEHETTEDTGLRHRDGTVSMARNAPGSASSEIFICVGDQPELDFGGRRNPDGQGFAAFGRVVRGMDVVHAIQKLPDRDQMLVEPVKILEVRRVASAAPRATEAP